MALNLVGQRFGRLTVLERVERAPIARQKCRWYKCRCDCGNVVEVATQSLRNGGTRSCGCLRVEALARGRTKLLAEVPDLVGQRFGRLTVLERAEPDAWLKIKRTTYKCRCDCGAIVEVLARNLQTGSTRSCGCLRSEAGRRNLSEWKKKQKQGGTNP